jgi:rhamnosyltransferase
MLRPVDASVVRVPVTLCIPVLNPGPHARELVSAIRQQTLRPERVVVVDSGSSDGAVDEFRQLDAEIHIIDKSSFDHGGTRNLAARLAPADIFVFLTQDAIPEGPDAIAALVSALRHDSQAGMAYGRQLPRVGAGAFASHSRMFNYPPRSDRRTSASIAKLGIRAAFCSNSFAAYRGSALEEVGGFPEHIIFGEDTVVAARMLSTGWAVRYVAGACVYHSHDYSLRQEFARYFDAGVFHAVERWYSALLGGASREGSRFVRSEIRYLRSQAERAAALRAIVRNGVRWIGYQIGRRYSLVPAAVRRRLGMNAAYWSARRSSGASIGV